ncbi:MAG: glycoside hydrolase family 3 protein [Flavobacteriia bacterium]|nr:glycoside hydrolase family 3 protein [Flavobacteriia bacterium]
MMGMDLKDVRDGQVTQHKVGQSPQDQNQHQGPARGTALDIRCAFGGPGLAELFAAVFRRAQGLALALCAQGFHLGFFLVVVAVLEVKSSRLALFRKCGKESHRPSKVKPFLGYISGMVKRMWPLTLALLSFGWGPAEYTESNPFKSRNYGEWIASATVEDLAGQMIMVAGYSRQGESHLQQLATWAEAGQIGGIIWMQGGPGRQRNAIARTQAAAMRGTGLPLLNAQDAEWGASMRLDSLERLPWPLTLGATRDPELARAYGKSLGQESRALGIHVNFSPVVDVNTNPANPIIGQRSLGSDVDQVNLRRRRRVEEGAEVGGADLHELTVDHRGAVVLDAADLEVLILRGVSRRGADHARGVGEGGRTVLRVAEAERPGSHSTHEVRPLLDEREEGVGLVSEVLDRVTGVILLQDRLCGRHINSHGRFPFSVFRSLSDRSVFLEDVCHLRPV